MNLCFFFCGFILSRFSCWDNTSCLDYFSDMKKVNIRIFPFGLMGIKLPIHPMAIYSHYLTIRKHYDGVSNTNKNKCNVMEWKPNEKQKASESGQSDINMWIRSTCFSHPSSNFSLWHDACLCRTVNTSLNVEHVSVYSWGILISSAWQGRVPGRSDLYLFLPSPLPL